jgi:tetratricopeptide (TPR) repeat protein
MIMHDVGSNDRPPNIDDVAQAAHSAWELKRYDEAASLFNMAARLESAEAVTRNPWGRPDSTILYEARHAFCLWEAGKVTQAIPTLERVVRFDWKGGRLWGDRRDTDTAFTYLLMNLANIGDRDRFTKRWHEATERCHELQLDFPWSRPNKRMLMTACMSLQYVDGCHRILDGLDNEALKDPELKLLAEQARRFLGLHRA